MPCTCNTGGKEDHAPYLPVDTMVRLVEKYRGLGMVGGGRSGKHLPQPNVGVTCPLHDRVSAKLNGGRRLAVNSHRETYDERRHGMDRCGRQGSPPQVDPSSDLSE